MSKLAEFQKMYREVVETECGIIGGQDEHPHHMAFGNGWVDADVMIVGEAPGEEEAKCGQPFVGRSGQLLNSALYEQAGLIRSECYTANVIKCRPQNNRDPVPEEIMFSGSWVLRQILLVKPILIITLGNFALRWMLEKPRAKIGDFHGQRWTTSIQGHQFTVLPAYHPSAALRGGSAAEKFNEDIAQARGILKRLREEKS